MFSKYILSMSKTEFMFSKYTISMSKIKFMFSMTLKFETYSFEKADLLARILELTTFSKKLFKRQAVIENLQD